MRHPMREFILTFLEKTKINFCNMNMAKGLIDESHPQFIGTYNGKYSSPGVQQQVEQADCILSFGTLLSDFNTGGFTSKLDANLMIEIHSHYVKIHHDLYQNVYFNNLIPELINKVHQHSLAADNQALTLDPYHASNPSITQSRFWQRMENFMQVGDIMVPESGTALFGLISCRLQNAITFISQALWCSIGYSVGAGLGALLAAPDRRILMFVGDGAFQCTVQEVSTMMRLQLNPIIFLINNDGYSIERAIHGPVMIYNDINMWDYEKLPHLFGENVWSTRVKSEADLELALQELSHYPDRLRLIEVIMDCFDYPKALQQFASQT